MPAGCSCAMYVLHMLGVNWEYYLPSLQHKYPRVKLGCQKPHQECDTDEDIGKACSSCGTTITPAWKVDPAGNTICNAWVPSFLKKLLIYPAKTTSCGHGLLRRSVRSYEPPLVTTRMCSKCGAPFEFIPPRRSKKATKPNTMCDRWASVHIRFINWT